ncbi:hypothetical protein [Nocardia arizonensis]|uniref:hypothetical protein n=1 Tax=Nocardia arizonensis TaxID=1141647 RepID=UPI0006D177B4|nr:hypothetical protein [Nocardia arizonensis]
MSYPQQYPGAYDPYPPAYGLPRAVPNAGTAITAGILAILGFVANVLGGGFSIWMGLSEFGSRYSDYDSTGLLGNDDYYDFLVVVGVVSLVIAIMLGVGSLLLFNRKSMGRALIAAGCVLTVISQIASLIFVVSAPAGASTPLSSGLGGVIGMVFPIATLVLALVPATGRWLAHRPPPAGAPGYGQPGYPQPGYPQAAYPQPGDLQSAYPQAAYPQPGYPQTSPAYSAPDVSGAGAEYTPAPIPQPGANSGDVTWQRPPSW